MKRDREKKLDYVPIAEAYATVLVALGVIQ